MKSLSKKQTVRPGSSPLSSPRKEAIEEPVEVREKTEEEKNRDLVLLMDKSIEYIAVALKKDKDWAHGRYDILKKLAEYSEYRAPNSSDITFLSQEAIAESKSARGDDILSSEKTIASTTEKASKFTELLRNTTRNRIEEIAKRSIDVSSKSALLWEQREAYRVDVDNKNAALAALVDKGKEAIQTEMEKEAIESGAIDPKKSKANVKKK